MDVLFDWATLQAAPRALGTEVLGARMAANDTRDDDEGDLTLLMSTF